MKKLKVGIIGVGRLGFEHASNLANRIPNAELVAINDANLERARWAADQLGVEKVYETPQELCADPEVEAVAIITNTDSHVAMIKIAMEAGNEDYFEIMRQDIAALKKAVQ